MRLNFNVNRNRSVLHAIATCLVVVGAAVMTTTTASAQDLIPKAAPQTDAMWLLNVHVHPVEGDVIPSGFVHFSNGKITEVGTMDAFRAMSFIRAPQTVDGEGQHLYPGMIGANTILGLMEIGAVRATMDQREVGNFAPEVRAIASVNPDSTIIPVTRSNGILVCATLPVGQLIPGRAAIIRLDGWTWEEMAVKPDAGLLLNWPNLDPITAWWMETSAEDQRKQARERLEKIDEIFDAAAAYIAARDLDPDTVPIDISYEAMRPTLDGTTPLLVRANSEEQIRSAIAFLDERSLGGVIIGGHDADRCTEELLRHDVPVILTGTHRLPNRRDDDFDRAFRLPSVLNDAGVRWCLATVGGSFDTPHERNLPYHAASAVAYGLDRDAAMRAITLSPAEILGIADRYGSLQAGKSATMFLCDGDPLEVTTNVTAAWIDGRSIELDDKQKALNRKYREKYRQLEEREANPGG